MKINRIVALLAMLLVTGGLLAACGGDDDEDTTTSAETTTTSETTTAEAGDTDASKEEYAQEIQQVLAPLGTTLQSLGTQISGSKNEDALAGGIGEAEDTISQAVSDLEGITPPEGVEQVHADLIAALEGFNGELTTVREAAESGDQQALQDAAMKLPEAALEFQEELSTVQQDAIAAGVPIDSAAGGQ